MNDEMFVIYCERHCAYLKTIGRWPSLHLLRAVHRGQVTATLPEGLFEVQWPGGETSVHFAENLQVVL